MIRATGSYLGGSGGYPSGGSVPTPPFAFGNALEFDGTNDYVTFGGANVLADPSSAWSFGGWFNITDFSGGSYPIAASFKSGSINNPYCLFFSNNGSYSDISIGSPSGTFIKLKGSVGGAFLGSWIHVAVTYDGVDPLSSSSFKLYVNGNSVATSASGALSSKTDVSQLGDLGTFDEFKGTQDEVSFWQQELTPTQVSNQYNGGSGNFADADVTPLVWFEMNGTSGDSTAVNNGSGGATYNGTLNNFDTSTCWVAH